MFYLQMNNEGSVCIFIISFIYIFLNLNYYKYVIIVLEIIDRYNFEYFKNKMKLRF